MISSTRPMRDGEEIIFCLAGHWRPANHECGSVLSFPCPASRDELATGLRCFGSQLACTIAPPSPNHACQGKYVATNVQGNNLTNATNNAHRKSIIPHPPEGAHPIPGFPSRYTAYNSPDPMSWTTLPATLVVCPW